MKAISTLLLLVACLLCKPLFAQETPETYISKFFTEYKTAPMLAIDHLYGTNPWMAKAKDAVEGLKSKLAVLTPDYVGDYYGAELITTKQLKDRLKVYVYMVKYERQPIRFIFKFYRANDKWMLYSFKFDDQLDDELEQSARLDNTGPAKPVKQ